MKAAVTLLVFLFGCTELGDFRQSLVDGSPESIAILAVVNDATISETLLDDDVGLDARAARNIFSFRAGSDGTIATADDNFFADIQALDDISYVGDSALSKLLDYARANGYLDDNGSRDERAILNLVNDEATTFELLDDDVGLDARAASGIVDFRAGADLVIGTSDDGRFENISQLDAVPYVGKSALEKLLDYALANGFAPSEAVVPCLLFSEVLEGWGQYNKAFELYNCGENALDLSNVRICMVRNGDTSCSTDAALSPVLLGAKDVWVVCRKATGTFNDPMVTIRNACDQEATAVTTFNGDDRLVAYIDRDGGESLSEGDSVLDQFGDPTDQPWGTPWADVDYRRCNLDPYLGAEPFYVTDYFAEFGRGDGWDLGVPPAPDTSCAQPVTLGEDCGPGDTCESGLLCQGIPTDGSSTSGICLDGSITAEEGTYCGQYSPCEQDYICAGWTRFGEGECMPQWMANIYESTTAVALPDAATGSTPGIYTASIVAYGLAEHPEDITVDVDIDHPQGTSLNVTLVAPDGSSATLWTGSTEIGAGPARSYATTLNRSGDANGRWTLRIEDSTPGGIGTLNSWKLFIVSKR